MISVIVPVYNADRFLKDCIESILSQSFKNFEVILVDDGSNDNSGYICDEYAQKDARVKVLHKPNEGVCVARNVGLDNAIGDWIVFVDSDDLLLPGALQTLYDAAESNNVDCVLAGSKVLNDGKETVFKQFNELKSNDAVSNAVHPALWGYIFKAELIRLHGLRFIPGLAYSEDRVFVCSYTMHCKNICVLSSLVYVYRVSNVSACGSSKGLRKAECQFWAASEIKKMCEQYPLNPLQRKWMITVKEQLLRLGCMAYVSKSFSIFTYRQYENLYLKFFKGRFNLFIKTILAYLTYQRRKLIVFSYNPGSRRKSMLKIK